MNKKKRLISVILAVITLVSLVPTTVFAEVIEKFEENKWTIIKFNDATITNPGESIYNGFKETTSVTPSGDGLKKPYATDTVTLTEKAEIFSWASYGNAVSEISVGDNFALSESGTAYVYRSYVKKEFGTSGINDLCYATGVAFDPTGCGKRNYIAVLGFHNAGSSTDSAAYLYVFNGDSQTLVASAEIDKGKFGWMYDSNGNLDLDNVDAGNFFQITAGDYNGDGRDSLVFYDGCVFYDTKVTPTNDSALYQYDYDIEAKTWSLTKIGLYTGYLNKGWYSSGGKGEPNAGAFWSYNASGKMHKALNVCLESGDINGDGIDDLAVVSCTGGLSKDEANSNIAQVATTLSVGFGKKGTSTIAELSISEQKTIYDDSTGHTPAAPGVSIGDIDGDGENEVVVAGFCNQPDNSAPRNLQDGEVVFAYFKAGDTTLSQTGGVQTLTDISPISKGDSVRRSQENTWQQFSVECVNFDGVNSDGTSSKDYIFLNGYVYQLDSSNKPQKVSVATMEKEVFSSVTTKMYGDKADQYDIDEVFIFSAAVGNFIGSSTGEESLSLTVGFHVNAGKSKSADSNAYYVGEITITKCHIDGNSRKDKLVGASSGNLTLIKGSSSGFHYLSCSNELVQTMGKDQGYEAGFNGMSFIRVACDVGTDSVIGEYVSTEAFYSDPEVVAVLQAAPYFKELEAGNSATVYSYSETYGKASGSSDDFTIGIGVCAEIETSHFKTEVEETLHTGISKEFEDSVETTYTTEFEANAYNQVILRRKLYYNYYYKIKRYDNGNLPDGMEDKNDGIISITVLRNPSVTALTFDQYNEYAEYYNDKMADNSKTARLNKISDANLSHYHLLNNEGNPGGYASALSTYGSKGFSMAKNNTWVELSSASGTISQQFEKSVGTEYTQTTTKGVEVNIKVLGGASYAGNGAYAGVSASMEYYSSKSETTSTVKTTTTKGTVQGIDSDLKDYSFQWQLIGWRATDDYPMFNKDVLFVGYLVNNVKSLPQPVSDLKESYSADTDTVTLTWTSPTIGNNRPQITEFYIYQDGEYVGSVANSGEGKEITFTKDVSNSNSASAEFYVLSRGYVNGTKKESIESNIVTSIFSMTKKQTEALIESMLKDLETQTDNLQTALDQKASSDDLKNAITALTEAYKNADSLLKKDINAAENSIKNLEKALESAKNALQKAIDDVQANLDSAVKDLKASDQANADALANATSELTEAYKVADALLQADIDAINDEIAELKVSIEAAHKALQEAINAVQTNLDDAIAKLNAAIASGDKKSAEALTQAINDMNKQLSDAYDVLVEQNKSLQNELNSAKDSFSTEIQSLRTELSAQKTEHEDSVQTAAEINGLQDSKQHTNSVVSVIGLSIAGVSFLANIALITYEIIRKRKQRPLA